MESVKVRENELLLELPNFTDLSKFQVKKKITAAMKFLAREARLGMIERAADPL